MCDESEAWCEWRGRGRRGEPEVPGRRFPTDVQLPPHTQTDFVGQWYANDSIKPVYSPVLNKISTFFMVIIL